MKDFFGIPVEIGDTILFIIDNTFNTGKIVEIKNDKFATVSITGKNHKTFINDGNFIIVNDIINNNPQYFI